MSDSDTYSSSDDERENCVIGRKRQRDDQHQSTINTNNNNNNNNKGILDFSDSDDDDGDRNRNSSGQRGMREVGFTEDSSRKKGRRNRKGGLVGDDDSDSDASAAGKSSSEDADGCADTTTAAPEPLHAMLARLLEALGVNESVGDAYGRLARGVEAAEAALHVVLMAASSRAPSSSDEGTGGGALAAAEKAVEEANEKKRAFHKLTLDLVSHHGVPTLSKDRAEIVELYYTDGMGACGAAGVGKVKVPMRTAAASGDGSSPRPPLPPAFALEWAHSKGKYFGPFTAQQMQGWKDRGVFAAKPAMTRNINSITSASSLWVNASEVEKFE